ncbi:MAG: LysE family translocator [Burkholderiales bacterium]|nr:LysE family translocator [Burkholderiales bacterium]
MEPLLPMALFAFVSSITPGPNNIMLASSGILYGFVRSVPHMLGITAGFGVMLALCAVGVGSMVLAVPALQLVLKAIGSTYLLYLAWQLRRMSFGQKDGGHNRPMTFLGAASFQFINPKAWFMAVTGASAFLPEVQPIAVAVVLLCVVFCVVNFLCISVWAGTGAALRRHLSVPIWQRVFCTVMVALTIYAAVSIWL